VPLSPDVATRVRGSPPIWMSTSDETGAPALLVSILFVGGGDAEGEWDVTSAIDAVDAACARGALSAGENSTGGARPRRAAGAALGLRARLGMRLRQAPFPLRSSGRAGS